MTRARDTVARGDPAIAERDLPLYRLGVDELPTACSYCGSAFLDRSPPEAADRFGLVTCVMCSRELARFTPLPRQLRPSQLPTSLAPQTPTAPPPPQAYRNVKLDGCSALCWQTPHGVEHDPITHEDYGRRLLLDDMQARPWAYGIPGGVDQIDVGPLRLDLPNCRILLYGRNVNATAGEWPLALCLARRPGQIVPHVDLIEAAWGVDGRRYALSDAPSLAVAKHRVRVTMGRLRVRLGPAGELVERVSGLGYRLGDPDHGGHDA